MAVTVTDWIAYAAERGTRVSTGTKSAQALVRASDYIRTRYLLRTGMSADDALAVEATYIAAGYELDTPGFWSTAAKSTDAKVLTKVDKIQWSPVEVKSGYGADMLLPVSPAIEALLLTGSTHGQPAVFVV